MVGHHGAPPGRGGHLEAGHPAKHFRQLARARQADEFAIEHGERAGGVFQLLRQPRGGVDVRYLAQVVPLRQLVAQFVGLGRQGHAGTQNDAGTPCRQAAARHSEILHDGSRNQAGIDIRPCLRGAAAIFPLKASGRYGVAWPGRSAARRGRSRTCGNGRWPGRTGPALTKVSTVSRIPHGMGTVTGSF